MKRNTFISLVSIALLTHLSANQAKPNDILADGQTINTEVSSDINTITAQNGGVNNATFTTSSAVNGNILIINNNGQNNLKLSSKDITLTLKGQTNQITSLDTINSTSGTLKLDAKNGGVDVVIANTLNGGDLTLSFGGSLLHPNRSATLTLEGKDNIIKNIALENNSIHNTLIIQGNTSITNQTTINQEQGIAFILKENTTLTQNQIINNGVMDFDFQSSNSSLAGGNITTQQSATTSFNLGSQEISTTTLTITSPLISNGNQSKTTFNVISKNVTLKSGSNGQALGFSQGLNDINFTNPSTLNWQDTLGNPQSIVTTKGSTTINFEASGTITSQVQTHGGQTQIALLGGINAKILGISTSNNAKTLIEFSSGTSTLSSNISTTNQATTQIYIGTNAYGVISGDITSSGGGGNAIFFDNSGTLILKGSTNTFSDVTLGKGVNILSLTEMSAEGKNKREKRKAIIQNITQNSSKLYLISQSSTTQADTFIIKGATSPHQGENHLGIVLENGSKIEDVGKTSPVLVASVAKSSKIDFSKTSQLISGFSTATVTFFTKDTDENGNLGGADYTSYFIGAIDNLQVNPEDKALSATAFMLNYDLYLANLNSLNKRMGELRNNPHTQGVWARIFNGAQSNHFGLGTQSNYTTIQAGYDYTFGFGGANNHLGLALSYALSTSSLNSTHNAPNYARGIEKISSNAIEVAIYNAYISDEGCYYDTLAKLSYLMSSFEINSPLANYNTSNKINNFALTFGNEVGYAFRLGGEKEWGLTPQVELTLGYFNQSGFKQTLEHSNMFLESIAQGVFILRTRAGSEMNYDFKRFLSSKMWGAKVYFGLFYEYDYVNGGDIIMNTDQGIQSNHLDALGCDGRVIINVGTNISIKDHTRLYFDFEKSFVGKITTDYQVNFGIRYSFGENKAYTPQKRKRL